MPPRSEIRPWSRVDLKVETIASRLKSALDASIFIIIPKLELTQGMIKHLKTTSFSPDRSVGQSESTGN